MKNLDNYINGEIEKIEKEEEQKKLEEEESLKKHQENLDQERKEFNEKFQPFINFAKYLTDNSENILKVFYKNSSKPTPSYGNILATFKGAKILVKPIEIKAFKRIESGGSAESFVIAIEFESKVNNFYQVQWQMESDTFYKYETIDARVEYLDKFTIPKSMYFNRFERGEVKITPSVTKKAIDKFYFAIEVTHKVHEKAYSLRTLSDIYDEDTKNAFINLSAESFSNKKLMRNISKGDFEAKKEVILEDLLKIFTGREYDAFYLFMRNSEPYKTTYEPFDIDKKRWEIIDFYYEEEKKLIFNYPKYFINAIQKRKFKELLYDEDMLKDI